MRVCVGSNEKDVVKVLCYSVSIFIIIISRISLSLFLVYIFVDPTAFLHRALRAHVRCNRFIN